MADGKKAKMAEKFREKKKEVMNERAVVEEVDIDELNDLTGGSIHDAKYTKTGDISRSTADKI